jgi:hypothetical protein
VQRGSKTVADCAAIRARLDAAGERHGRDPVEVDLSFMAAALMGRDRHELQKRTAAVLRRRGEEPDVHRFLATTGADWFTGRWTRLPGGFTSWRPRMRGGSICSTCSTTTWRWCGWPARS